MKRDRLKLKKYAIHILAVPAVGADTFDLPMAQNAVISCTDRKPGGYLESGNIPHRLALLFPDTEDSRVPGAFNAGHAGAVARFLDGLPDSVTDLYICCAEGQSRSAGLAAALLKGSRRSDRDVWRNPFYAPNQLVYREMCRELGIAMPRFRARALKRLNARAYRKAQKTGNAGGYERWQILE